MTITCCLCRAEACWLLHDTAGTPRRTYCTLHALTTLNQGGSELRPLLIR